MVETGEAEAITGPKEAESRDILRLRELCLAILSHWFGDDMKRRVRSTITLLERSGRQRKMQTMQINGADSKSNNFNGERQGYIYSRIRLETAVLSKGG